MSQPQHRQQKISHHQQSNQPVNSHQSHRLVWLQAERLRLERETERMHTKGEALTAKWQLWYQEKAALESQKPLAIAQVGLSILGVRRLPPIAGQWQSRSIQLDQARHRLALASIDLNAHLEALHREKQLIEAEINLLQP